MYEMGDVDLIDVIFFTFVPTPIQKITHPRQSLQMSGCKTIWEPPRRRNPHFASLQWNETPATDDLEFRV